MVNFPVIDPPFKCVTVDIVGPIDPCSDKRNRYILTMIDYATRYPIVVPLLSLETEHVADALVEMFSWGGIRDDLITDYGAQFTLEIMKEVSILVSLQQFTTMTYHSMCNR